MRRAADSAKVFSRETKQIGMQATQIGSQLTRTLTLPILGFGGAVAKAAIDFESSFAGVRKTVNASEAEFARLSQQMRDLSKEIPVNVNELNKLGEAAGALGIPKEEIVGFTKVMALLGVTTNVTSAQAAESIAQIQTVFQAAGKDTDRFAAALVDLGNKGASTEAQILEMANRLASAGRNIGLTQAQVLGFASAMANVGIEAEAGGTAMSKVFADISMAVSIGGEEVAAFAKIAGKSAADFAKMFKADAAGAVTAFIEGLGKARAAGGDLNLILKDLGFIEARQARALRDLGLSGDNLSKALRIASTAWRENTALSEEAQKRFNTTSAQLTLLWNRVKDVAITLGNALLPMIKSIVSALNTFVPWLERAANAFAILPMPIQAVAVALGLVAAAAGPLLFVFGQLTLSASALAGAFTKKGLATRGLTLALGQLVLVQRIAAIDAAITARAYISLAGAQTLAGASALVMGARMTLATAQTVAANIATRATAAGQAALTLAMNLTGASALVMGARMAVSSLAIRASAAASGLAAAATGALSVAYLGLTRVLGPLVLVFAAFELGKWIEQATGLGTAIGKLTLRFLELVRLVPKGTADWYAHARAQAQSASATRDQAEAQKQLAEIERDALKDRLTGDDLKKQVDKIRTSVIELNKAGRMTPDVWRSVAAELKALQAQGAKLTPELQFTVDSWGKYAPAVKTATVVTTSMTAAMKAANAAIAGLTGAQRAELKAGIDLNKNNEDIAKSFAALFPNVKMTEEIVGIFRDQLASAGKQAKDTAKDLKEAEQAARDWLDIQGEIESKQMQRDSDARRADIMGDFEAQLRGIESTVDGYFDAAEKKEKIDADWRQHTNEMGVLIMDSEAAQLEARKKHWQSFRDTVANLFAPIRAGIGDAFGALIFGTGDDSAVKRAEEDLRRIKSSGKASAEEITRAYRALEDAQDEFGGRFKAFWQGLVNSLKQTLNNFLQYFIQGFMNGMIKALAGTGLGQKVGGWLSSALGFGGGGIPGLGAASGVAGLFGIGGGASAGILGASAAPSLAAILGTAPVGAGAAAGAGGGLAGLGALMTNPWTIGIAAAAIGGALLWKAGVGRGGWEGVEGNKLRDQYIKSKGGTTALGNQLLQAFMKQGLSYDDAEKRRVALMDNLLFKADTRKEFDSATKTIDAALGVKSRSFAMGGFVPPNVTMPAILHGGRYGEDIVPRNNPEGQFNRGTRIEIHNHISAIDARGIREFVESKQYLDSMSRVFEDNKGFIGSRVGRALKP